MDEKKGKRREIFLPSNASCVKAHIKQVIAEREKLSALVEDEDVSCIVRVQELVDDLQIVAIKRRKVDPPKEARKGQLKVDLKHLGQSSDEGDFL